MRYALHCFPWAGLAMDRDVHALTTGWSGHGQRWTWAGLFLLLARLGWSWACLGLPWGGLGWSWVDRAGHGLILFGHGLGCSSAGLAMGWSCTGHGKG